MTEELCDEEIEKNNFLDRLLDCLTDSLLATLNEGAVTKDSVKKYISGENRPEQLSSAIVRANEAKYTVLSNFYFPDNSVSYKHLFSHLRFIVFDNCTFESKEIDLHTYGLGASSNVFLYKNCHFVNDWNLLPYTQSNYDKSPDSSDYDAWAKKNSIIANREVLYINCIFDGAVIKSYKDTRCKIISPLFQNCQFKNNLSLSNTEFISPIFKNSTNYEQTMNNLFINNCTINDKFALNKCDIKEFKTQNTVFEKKFEFKNCHVDNFNFSNTNFKKIADAYNTKFNKFNIRKTIFSDFVGFEKAIFAYKKESCEEKDLIATFTYVTFESISNFRYTKFNGGLDIEDINLTGSVNFLGTDIKPKNTNQETFRIIKHSFDKVGNYTEGNKYFSEEMRKYRNWAKKNGSMQDKIVLYCNHHMSHFGQSYWRPFWLIIAFSIIYYLLVLGYENNTLYIFSSETNYYIGFTIDIINGVAKSVLPVSKFLKEGMEFISLIFSTIFGALIWQLIIAVKRHTKR